MKAWDLKSAFSMSKLCQLVSFTPLRFTSSHVTYLFHSSTLILTLSFLVDSTITFIGLVSNYLSTWFSLGVCLGGVRRTQHFDDIHTTSSQCLCILSSIFWFGFLYSHEMREYTGSTSEVEQLLFDSMRIRPCCDGVGNTIKSVVASIEGAPEIRAQLQPNTLPDPTSSPKAGLQRKLPATPNSFTKITRIPLKPPQLARELSSDGSDDGARRRRRPRKEFKCLPVMTPFFFYPRLRREDSIESHQSDTSPQPPSPL
ncbi:hypothetical protein PC9H_010283 [Pleurotus ostreatus]|uniref:Uncharacterized protein n=1 Tax=Pleurotus ostreatus TaxID=5322 RepID=A0A8H6ZRB7_PLEOS|nr:uncharacterized protein PC9H_002778 [Pleurotus ostreatus]XP_036629166.1 uncharacterized protein PC9H_010283 [Pleurotus ostreatus]KAF7416034.1 hypothetical protein PC9H_002778 [Pleurotus ostreatus]KAF7424972.1 hypothetical protein PC9H_010283 [Pleurotus ostreatus]